MDNTIKNKVNEIPMTPADFKFLSKQGLAAINGRRIKRKAGAYFT